MKFYENGNDIETEKNYLEKYALKLTLTSTHECFFTIL